MSTNLKKKKKIIKKISILYWFQFEIKALYISYKLIKLKNKKKNFVKPVEYLKTSRYVIPLPSNDDNQDDAKKKNHFIPNIGLTYNSLYNYYDNYFKLQRGLFLTSFYLNYNPDKFGYINKFDYNIWFDILWALKNVYWLLAEKSFFYSNIKFYFSTKKFKFFSSTFFKALFKLYWNPNLPLPQKWGENYTAKQEGTSILLIWDLIFRQLLVESLKLTYNFSSDELKIFKTANINPKDTSFFWPTRWLYLIGMSSHDGQIKSINSNYYRSFSQIPTSEIKNHTLITFKKLIMAQFLYWKEVFLDLAENKKLIYDFSMSKSFNFSFYKTSSNIPKYNFKTDNSWLGTFIEKKLLKQPSLIFTQIPIPTHYLGTEKTFFKKNYLESKLENLPKNYSLLLNESNLEIFLLKLSFFKFKGELDDELETILNSIYYFNWHSKKYNKYYDASNKRFEFLSIKNVIKLLNSNLNYNTTKELLIPIPEFLKDYFFLLTQVNLTKEDLDQVCILPILKNLPAFLDEKKKKKKN